MAKNHVWVVEMLDRGKWLPCSKCSIIKENGKQMLRGCKEINPSWKFRIKKYIAED